jgi:hypothetical protein
MRMRMMAGALLLAALLLVALSSEGLLLSTSTSTSSFSQQLGLLPDSHTNVLQLPTVGVFLVVDGEGPVSDEEWTPFLKGLVATQTTVKNVKEILASEDMVRAKKLGSEDGFVFATSSLEEVDRTQVWWKVVKETPQIEVEPFLRNDRKQSGVNAVVVEKQSERLGAELALIKTLVHDVSNKENRPAFVFAEIFGLKNRASAERSASFAELSSGLETILRQLKQTTSRPLFQIVFTEKKQGPSPSSITEVEAVESRRLLQTTAATFTITAGDYVLMSWTLLAIVFLVIFAIICIPWAPELDPVLRSTLKPDTKRE